MYIYILTEFLHQLYLTVTHTHPLAGNLPEKKKKNMIAKPWDNKVTTVTVVTVLATQGCWVDAACKPLIVSWLGGLGSVHVAPQPSGNSDDTQQSHILQIYSHSQLIFW